MSPIQNFFDLISHERDVLSLKLSSYDPLVLTSTAVVGTACACYLWNLHRDDIGIVARVSREFYRYARMLPFIKRQIQKARESVRGDVAKAMLDDDRSGFIHHLPNSAVDRHYIKEIAQRYNAEGTVNHQAGEASGAVFAFEDDQQQIALQQEMIRMYAYSNPLWPSLFPAIRKMEAEVVRMSCNLMNGDENTCGTMSSGGTISILLACLAHRNRLLKKGVTFPEMVLPSSAHAAFFKACEVFRITKVVVPLDDEYKVDLKKMKAAITSRTCMLVGSAPNYPYGTIDDIEAIGRLGLKYDIPVHVDACLGGFLLPFIRDQEDIPFDFRTPGVSSISADTHKYGLTPKGSSVVLYRNKELRQNQYYCDADWQGGIYATSTLEGSRCGHNVALCWATMLYHGFDKYRETSLKVIETTRYLNKELATVPGLKMLGNGTTCIIAFTSEEYSIHRFVIVMAEKRWQLSHLQFPSATHLMVTLLHAQEGVKEKFIDDCKNVAMQLMDEKKKSVFVPDDKSGVLYGTAQKIPDRTAVAELSEEYIDATYDPPTNYEKDFNLLERVEIH